MVLSRLTHGAATSDPLLQQAEAILSQRLSRSSWLDRDILGEPGWDILLCAFIASRKGVDCAIEEVAAKIDLAPAIARRWVSVLEKKNMLTCRSNMFFITDDTEQKLAGMFRKQIDTGLRCVEF